MKYKLGVVMDPIESINIKKDSTFAMLLAAQQRGWSLHYMEMADLFVANETVRAQTRRLQVKEDQTGWFAFEAAETIALAELDVVLMRKDPPFDMEYVYATYLLELAEAAGCLVVNAPRTLRDANEKVFTAHFPHCCPPLVISRHAEVLRAFLAEHQEIVLKPLDGMGGRSIFRVRSGDPNTSVIIETLIGASRGAGERFCMAQRFLPEITDGDKRVLIVDGEPVPSSWRASPPPASRAAIWPQAPALRCGPSPSVSAGLRCRSRRSCRRGASCSPGSTSSATGSRRSISPALPASARSTARPVPRSPKT